MHRYTIRAERCDRELISGQFWMAGAQGVWEQPDGLAGWFTTSDAPVPPGGTWQVEPDVDWQAGWKASIQPVLAGPVAIVPTWLADDFVRPTQVDTVVVLDPGQAFGSGHHATTTLCTEYLAAMDLEGQRVFDVGTGTGVLAMVAVLRGASDVLAVDIDPVAVEVTLQNAKHMGIPLRCEVGSADHVQIPFDVVVANLVTDVVTALADDLADRVAPGGALITSGIDASRAGTPRGRLQDAGLVLLESRVRDGWAGDLWSRPA